MMLAGEEKEMALGGAEAALQMKIKGRTAHAKEELVLSGTRTVQCH